MLIYAPENSRANAYLGQSHLTRESIQKSERLSLKFDCASDLKDDNFTRYLVIQALSIHQR